MEQDGNVEMGIQCDGCLVELQVKQTFKKKKQFHQIVNILYILSFPLNLRPKPKYKNTFMNYVSLVAQCFQDKVCFIYRPLPSSPFISIKKKKKKGFFSQSCSTNKIQSCSIAMMVFKLVCSCCASSLCYQQGRNKLLSNFTA